jgi:transposase
MQQSASIESLDDPRIAANIRAFLAFAQDRCGTARWRPRNTTLLFLPPFAPELNPNKNPL